MIDPFGALLVLLRADPAVAGIAGVKVRGEASGDPPMVVITDDGTTRRPFGPGSGRIGMQLVTYLIRTYGPDNPTGAIQARQLAGAVSDVLHGLPPTTVGTKYLARGYAPEISGLLRDPETRWPYHVVTVDLYAATEAVA
jgi:hypothetical protein